MTMICRCITMKAQVLLAILLTGVAAAAKIPDISRDELLDGSSQFVPTSGKLGMYGGTDSTIKRHPYLVSLVQNGTSYCGGTILNANWVLTNGDCTNNRQPSDITVVSGSNDGVKGVSHTVKQIVPHPKYGKVHLDFDYALIQINNVFKWSRTVKAAELPTTEVEDYTWLDVAGYGSSSAIERSANNQLQEGQLQWLNKGVCKTMFSTLKQWTDNFACAYNPGQTTLCKGDFGDGLMQDNVVYGIFTAGLTANFCTSNSMPCIFADVITVVDWINATISQ